MKKPKKTQEGLPIVRREAYETFLAEFRRDYHKMGELKYVDEILYRIRCENPAIYNLINKFSDKVEGDEDHVALGMVLLYQFLKAQGGANLVEEMWFPKTVTLGEVSFPIPSKLVEALGWEDNESLEAEVTDDSIIIKRPKKD